MAKNIFIIVIVTLMSITLNAQQIPSLSQFMENNYMVNPAVAGTKNYSPLVFNYKRWWSGMDDAPAMQSISSHFQASDNVGLGGKIFNYATGPLSKMGIEATYAYHLKLGANGDKLSLGLSAQLYQVYLNKSLLKLEEQDDNAVIYGSEKLITPDAAFGIYYYNEHYYAGLAAYQLFNRKVDMMTENILENRQVRHYFLNGGYIYDINNNYSIEPSVLVKYIESGVFQGEMNVKGIYKQSFWVGLGYRTQDAIVINAGIRKDRFVFGYAYDYSINEIRKHSIGSHELLFIVKFNRSKPKLEQ
ncbi:MAG: type IX secretion system membrane protein PorP/SprF [Bacteroidales bacterium]|nr:type IX secretion system membrane protein PorP/SprF [Bacteroidales bacterium]